MEIKAYKDGDQSAILGLFEQSFGKSLSEAFWKWRFLDNPTGKIMIQLMWDGAVLAGHYAASPVYILRGEERILTALSMTTMTHPAYAGKGIFTQLADRLYENEFENNQVQAVWGFPNNNSHYAFIKNLGWQNLEQIPTFSVSSTKITARTGTSIQRCETFTDLHYRAAQEVLSSYLIKIERSKEYLNWRFTQHPENEYHTFESVNGDLAYFVVTKVFPSFDIKGKYEVDLVEFIVPDNSNMITDFLAEIKHFYSEFDVIKFNLWLPLDDKKHILLEKIGFTNTAPITYLGLKSFDTTNALLNFSKNWDYSMGYSDIY